MQSVTVQFDLDMEYALMEGRAQSGTHLLELTDAEVGKLTEVERKELLTFKSSSEQANFIIRNAKLPHPTFEALKSFLASSIEKREQKDEEQARNLEEKLNQWLEMTGKGPVFTTVPYITDSIRHRLNPDLLAKVQEEGTRRQKAMADIAALRKKAEEYAKKEKDRQEAEKQAAKAKYIAEWVREHGTLSQKDRLAEDLLPRSEALESIANWGFSAYSDYAHVELEDLKPACKSDECDESCETGRDTIPAKGLRERTYERFKALRATASAALPGATVEPVLISAQHTCDHEDGCKAATMSAAKVTIMVGPFQFVRHYPLKEAD